MQGGRQPRLAASLKWVRYPPQKAHPEPKHRLCPRSSQTLSSTVVNFRDCIGLLPLRQESGLRPETRWYWSPAGRESRLCAARECTAAKTCQLLGRAGGKWRFCAARERTSGKTCRHRDQAGRESRLCAARECTAAKTCQLLGRAGGKWRFCASPPCISAKTRRLRATHPPGGTYPPPLYHAPGVGARCFLSPPPPPAKS